MEVVTFTLPDGSPRPIMPLGDLQLDPKLRSRPRAADIKRFRRAVDWGLANDAYFLGMGDYVDVASPSNRKVLDKARGDLYDNATDMLDEAAAQTQDELHELLADTRGRWLGLLSGHHLWDYRDGKPGNTDTRLADFLGCPHLGTSAFINVRFPPNGRHAAPSFRIWAHHGLGGGKLLATPLNQLEHVLKAFEADLYFVGHHHKAVAAKYPILTTEGGERGGASKLVHRDRILACTGSFLRGYLQGNKRGSIAQGSYVEAGMMNPVSLGCVSVSCTPRYTRDGYSRVEFDYRSH